MRSILQALVVISMVSLLFACKQNAETATAPLPTDIAEGKKQIAAMLDSFNVAAADADYTRYFNFFTEDATFNGTDATENWNKKTYMAWAKPYFDKKTTWHFTAINRNIYFGKYADMAWFEELLNTQMKICRGSGLVVREGSQWKVQQYVLSTSIPNSKLDSVISLKAATEDSLIQTLSSGNK